MFETMRLTFNSAAHEFAVHPNASRNGGVCSATIVVTG